MRKSILYMALTILLCLALSACSSTKTEVISKDTDSPLSSSSPSEVESKEITLYANFSAGCEQAEELDLIKTKTVTVKEVSAETIANALSEWSGLDFTINSATVSQNRLIVDWSTESTLIANLDDRTQKEDFHFLDEDSMRWFMMDSLCQSCTENMSIDEVYYTVDGGEELSFEELYPVSAFPKDIPYMSSPFYFSHVDSNGEVTEEGGDMGDKVVYAPTVGIWRIDGSMDTAYIDMDGQGSYTIFYASGSVETEGYLTYNADDGRYYMYTDDNMLWDIFYITSENELVMGYDAGTTFKKDN